MTSFWWNKTQAVETLKNALFSVDPSYYSVITPLEDSQYIERVFAYELYHQMRLRFPVKNGCVDSMVIHGEYRKALKFVPDLENERTVIPDLVVHQSQTLQNNLLAIEIKSSRYPKPKDIIADLDKLRYYSQRLRFDVTLLIMINSKFEDVYFKNDADRNEISSILHSCGKVRIWNIDAPIARKGHSGIGMEDFKLDPTCLRIIDSEYLKTIT